MVYGRKKVLFFTEISGIGFNRHDKYARAISEKSLEQKSATKNRSEFSSEIVL